VPEQHKNVWQKTRADPERFMLKQKGTCAGRRNRVRGLAMTIAEVGSLGPTVLGMLSDTLSAMAPPDNRDPVFDGIVDIMKPGVVAAGVAAALAAEPLAEVPRSACANLEPRRRHRHLFPEPRPCYARTTATDEEEEEELSAGEDKAPRKRRCLHPAS